MPEDAPRSTKAPSWVIDLLPLAALGLVECHRSVGLVHAYAAPPRSPRAARCFHARISNFVARAPRVTPRGKSCALQRLSANSVVSRCVRAPGGRKVSSFPMAGRSLEWCAPLAALDLGR